MPRPAPTDMFDHYKSLTLRQPRLNRAEEAELLARFQAGDRAAGDRVARAMLGFVVSIALRYARRYKHVTLEDFVGAGNEGLLRAMRKFDPKRDCRLTTYSAKWIRVFISKLALRDWSIVATKDAAFRGGHFARIQRAMREAQVKVGNDAEALELAAAETGIEPEKFARMLHRILDRDASLDVTPDDGGPSFVARLMAVDSVPLAALEAKDDAEHARDRVRKLLGCLDPRERHILLETVMGDPPRTLADVGSDWGITRQRVTQLRNRAMRRLCKLAGSDYVPLKSRMARTRRSV